MQVCIIGEFIFVFTVYLIQFESDKNFRKMFCSIRTGNLNLN